MSKRLNNAELDVLEKTTAFHKDYLAELVQRTAEVPTVSDAVLADYLVDAMNRYCYYIGETTDYADAAALEAARRLRKEKQ